MGVSYETMLNKMEHELRKAKESKGEKELHGHLYTLKTLIEVMLEDEHTGTGPVHTFVKEKAPELLPSEQVIPMQTSERLNTGGGANGDSIFDF